MNKIQHDYIKKAGVAGRALLGIINDILDFSKIEAGKLDLEHSEFMLYELLNNIIDMFSSKVAEQGIELIVSVSPDVPEILIGDSLRLGQVLINLINNSIKFTESGEVIVWVSQLKSSDDKITLQFLVSDTGIGMTPEQQLTLFSSFSQADTSTTRKFGGTGLGLTISKRIIELMNGKIWVKSEDQQGSVFACTADLGFKLSNEYQKKIPDDIVGKRILIQNENAAFREILLMFLMYFSFKVHAVSSKAELYEALAREAESDKAYDLIIMPKMDDEYEYLNKIETIKNKIRVKKTPVIITADFGHDEIERSEINIANIIVKPVKQTELINVIMEVFGQKPVFESIAIDEDKKEKEGLKKLKNAKILLVEDNEINQEVATAILSKIGIIIDVANNGLEAVNIIKKQKVERHGESVIMPYDAILMDLQMPEMDGYEATESIRRWENHNLPEKSDFMPIIAMSAHAISSEIEKCTSAGMNSYVSKPIDTKALFSELIKWIGPVKRKDVYIDHSYNDESSEGKGIDTPNTVSTDFPDYLDGFNLVSGLEKLSNNKELYKKLLIKFYKKNCNSTIEMKESLKNNNKEEAVRLAHTIKGVAGNLGAEQLFEKAGDLEKFISDNFPVKPENELGAFSKEIDIVLNAIKPFVYFVPEVNQKPDEQHSEQSENYDITKITQKITQVIKLIEDDIEEARTGLEDLEKVLSADRFKVTFRRINTNIEDYEIDSVIDELKSLQTIIAAPPEKATTILTPVVKDQKILIVDDVSENIEILMELLKSDYKIIAAKSGERALKIANSSQPPDLILLDINMPGMDGYEVCERLKASDHTKDIPIIFITAASDVTEQTKGFKLGAVDYITKPIVPVIVKVRVQTQLKIKKQQDMLANLAIIDGLTQIPNRRKFDEVFETEWKRGQRDGNILSLILMDIDHFKQFNDNYGHQAGDECLIKVAVALSSVCRRSADLVARYGGEEFVAVLPDTDSEGALKIADMMRKKLESLNLSHEFSSAADHVTISQGIASIVPTKDLTTKQVIEMSDSCLYDAKESGRNRAVVKNFRQ